MPKTYYSSFFSAIYRTDPEATKKTTPVEAAAPVAAVPAVPFSAQSAAEAAFLVGDEYNEITTNLMEMGFSREMVRTQLRPKRARHLNASIFRTGRTSATGQLQ